MLKAPETERQLRPDSQYASKPIHSLAARSVHSSPAAILSKGRSVIPPAKRPKIHRIGDDVEADFAKHADRPRHVIGRRHEQPAVLRRRLEHRFSQRRVLVGIARVILDHDTVGLDARIDEKFPNIRADPLAPEERSAASREDDFCVWKRAGEAQASP